jgi:hypothetical protein
LFGREFEAGAHNTGLKLVQGRVPEADLGRRQAGMTKERLRRSQAGLAPDVIGERVAEEVRVDQEVRWPRPE